MCFRLISIEYSLKNNYQQTDGRTDTPSHKDARTQLKIMITFVALSDDGDAEEVDSVHVESDGYDVQGERRVGDGGEGGSAIHLRRRSMLSSSLFEPTSATSTWRGRKVGKEEEEEERIL